MASAEFSVSLGYEGPFAAAPSLNSAPPLDLADLFSIDFHLHIIKPHQRDSFRAWRRCSHSEYLSSRFLDWMKRPLEVDAGLSPLLADEIIGPVILTAGLLWGRRNGDYRVRLIVEIMDNHQESSDHINVVEESLKKIMIEGEASEDCTICLMEFSKGEEVSRMPCSHLFHGDCIGKWLKKNPTCPNCRRSAVPPIS